MFSEPTRVETVRPDRPEIRAAGLVGQRSERFLRVILAFADISTLTIINPTLPHGGDGRHVRVRLKAYRDRRIPAGQTLHRGVRKGGWEAS